MISLFNAVVLLLLLLVNVYRRDLGSAAVCFSGAAGWFLLYLSEKGL